MAATDVPAFRHAQWDTPWWVNANRNAGRYNRADEDVTQYWCLHPLGVAAEFLRQLGPAAAVDLSAATLRMWTARIRLDGVVRVGFGDATRHGLRASDLVGEDLAPTQALADRLRAAGAAGLIAPSAALPGTENLVLFGARLRLAYLGEPLDRHQVPTAHVSDGPPVAEVVDEVCWHGAPHPGLAAWSRVTPFVDPAPART